MIHYLRPAASFAAAAATYWAMGRLLTPPGRRYLGWPRYLRSVGVWIATLTVYAFVAETSGTWFTWEWLVECLLKGDWVFVALASPILAACEAALRRRAASGAHASPSH